MLKQGQKNQYGDLVLTFSRSVLVKKKGLSHD